MKKYLLLVALLGAFTASIGTAFADSDEDHDQGGGNDQRNGYIDEGGSHETEREEQ